MIFRVVWIQKALNELAAAWMQADSSLRQAITAATHTIDHLLQTDPLNQGESRSHGQRLTFQPPLGVTFEIRLESGVVRVLHVWIIRQRAKQ